MEDKTQETPASELSSEEQEIINQWREFKRTGVPTWENNDTAPEPEPKNEQPFLETIGSKPTAEAVGVIAQTVRNDLQREGALKKELVKKTLELIPNAANATKDFLEIVEEEVSRLTPAQAENALRAGGKPVASFVLGRAQLENKMPKAPELPPTPPVGGMDADSSWGPEVQKLLNSPMGKRLTEEQIKEMVSNLPKEVKNA